MNQKDNIINPNIHIQEYLENYLKLSNPEYTILLNGKWGSGKTYFIDTFISEYKESNIKFIKISLFGLKDTNSIDEEIFQNLHPLLGTKYAKITGNIVKSALKLGVNFDWNQDDKKDGTANVDLKEFNPLDFFSDKKKLLEKHSFEHILTSFIDSKTNLSKEILYTNTQIIKENYHSRQSFPLTPPASVGTF